MKKLIFVVTSVEATTNKASYNIWDKGANGNTPLPRDCETKTFTTSGGPFESIQHELTVSWIN